jgi:hypothetical protein
MKRIVLFAAGLVLLNASRTLADEIPRASVGSSASQSTYFPGCEPTIDVFGTVRDNWHLGVGVGANYFFTQFFGAGVETRVERFDWPNQINASLMARYPIDKVRLAPYVYGGGGRQYMDGAQWLAHIGGGVDYRIRRGVGLFTDVRETFAEKHGDYALWRFGLRLRF